MDSASNWISAFAGSGSFAVAFAVLWLERKAVKARRPRLTLWIENGGQSPVRVSVFNSGAEPVVVRKLDVESLQHNYGIFFQGGAFNGQNSPLTDFVFAPNQLYPLFVHCNTLVGGHFLLRFQWLDGKFTKLEIDPAKLGPYQLEF